METDFENDQLEEEQWELILMRESHLYLIVARIKMIKRYLDELREIRNELKMADLLAKISTPIEHTKYLTNNKTTIMETTHFLSEHQYVLKQTDDMVDEIETLDDKFANIDVIYNLETADELLCALGNGFEKLNKLYLDYIEISSLINPVYLENTQKLLSSHEGNIGIIEKDERDILHCGDCLVPQNYCQDLVGKMVRISHITLNKNRHSRNKYQTYAYTIDLVY